MNLQSNDFELFGLDPSFAQERSQIDARWKALQQEVHPDRFIAQGEAAQRLAMQWSVRVNEAYQRLKDPQRRAAYLCEMHGAAIRAEDNTAMPTEFLMQQLEWRETLDEASNTEQTEQLKAEVEQARQVTLQRCADLLDQQKNYVAAAQQVRSLMFITRFAADIQQRLAV